MENKFLKAVCSTHIGERSNYEDNFLFNSIYLTSDVQKQILDRCLFFIKSSNDTIELKVRLFAISDGMGGHNAGEVASRICVEKLAETEKILQRYSSIREVVEYLQLKIVEINHIVCEMSHKYDELKGMGATLVLVVIYEKECAILNIGDSRAYYFNNSSLIQITKDHTEGQRMLDFGLLTRKELLGFSARKNLNRYIGYTQNGYVLQADEYYLTLADGVILLCSDGISDSLTEREILEILNSTNDLESVGKQLINKAISIHNADNTTVILISLRR